MDRFGAQEPNGIVVQQLEGLLRNAIFKPANVLVEYLLQGAADRIDAAYQPKAGECHSHPSSLRRKRKVNR